MSELSSVEFAVKSVSRRKRWQSAWRGFWIGAFSGSAVILAVVGCFKFYPLPEWVFLASWIAGLVLAAAGFAIGWMQIPRLGEVARWVDLQENLQERLSTALELAQSGAAPAWQQLVVADAAQHAGRINAHKLVPLRLHASAKWTLLALAVCAGLGFVPEYRSAKQQQKAREEQVVREVGRGLEQLVKRNLETRPPVLEPTQRAMESVTDLASALGKNQLTRGEALREVGKVAEMLQKQAEELEKNPAIRKLDKAAQEATTASASNQTQLQKKIQEMEDKLGKSAAMTNVLDKLKEEMARLKAEAKGMPEKGTPEGDAARQKLQDAMNDLARQTRSLGQNLEGLEQAIEALQANNTDLFLKDLDLALKDLEKLRDLAKSLSDAQKELQMGGKLGKDLAEQLKLGQAEAAANTLDKMVEKLQSGQISPEQFQKILEEVKNAVDPASEYGQVAEKLAEAVKQMTQGKNPMAAQKLDAAARELEELLKQASDCQSLSATLEALEKANLALGTCQGWGQCKGMGRPKAGPGGKGGRGVGTWAEEEGWLYSPQTREELWDASDLVRPDLDPRGDTPRDSQRPDNMDSTQIRGSIAPGTAMPSINLKGVSIKGTSSVQYEQAAAAAQAEAQSALNQDQVPRAYRESVKGYFDDFNDARK